MTEHEEPGPFHAARNDRDSERWGEEFYGVRQDGKVGWCAVTYGIRTSMTSTREEAEEAARRLNAIHAT